VLDAQFRKHFDFLPGEIQLAAPTLLAGNGKRKEIVPVFLLMFAGVTMVLLLACANVGNLLLARAAARRHEIEVRRAVGAARKRIVRQLLTEGFVLALGACALGVALAAWVPSAIFAAIGDGPNVRLAPDATVIAYAAALAAVACVAFALAPALQSTRVTQPHVRNRLRSVLLGTQVAFSMVLLVGAMLMLAGVRHMKDRDPGFRIQDVAVISLDLPASAYNAPRLQQFYRQLSLDLEKLAQPAGISMRAPLSNSHWMIAFRRPGEPEETAHRLEFDQVTPAWFDVLGIPVVAGRNFTTRDEQSILVNQTFVQQYFEHENPIGKQIIIKQQPREIVGVVGDALLTGLERPVPLLFEPFDGNQLPKLVVRTSSTAAFDLIASAAKQIEPRVRVYSTPLSENVDQQLAPTRVGAEIAGLLGVFALALAAIGMSGVFAFIVEQRTKEIGIRIALGALPKQVIALVLSGTLRAVVTGLAIGYVATAAFAKIAAEYLYGISPFDLRAYLAAAVILALAGLSAAFIPARRATRIDPTQALRVD
jgi:predicted permease